MKKIIAMTLIFTASIGAQAFAGAKDVVRLADQELEQISSKTKRDKILKKLEKALTPEKRAELITEIQNSELPETQKAAMTSVLESIEE